MMKECPYTASSRDVSENTPPSALEISLVRGFCTPRPSRLPSGFALGQSLGPRGAKSPPLGNLLGLGGCIFRYIPPLGSVRIQFWGHTLYWLEPLHVLYFELNRPRVLKSLLWQLCQFGSQDQDNPIPSFDLEGTCSV